MKIVLILTAAIAALLGVACRDEITIDPTDPNKAKIDWSTTDLMQIYCEAKNKQCPGSNIGVQQFAPTPKQCQIRCSNDLTCLSAFYGNDKKCQLKSARCELRELVDADGTDYYRLKKGEKCTSDRPEFVGPTVAYSNKFCVLKGKACTGYDLYDKPQNIFPLAKCVEKCAKIDTCSSVDYDDAAKKCSPKGYQCKDEELTNAPTTYNAMRLVQGVDKCSGERDLQCPDNSHSDGTNCVCNTQFKMLDGKCVPVCGDNAHNIGTICECDAGYVMVGDKCQKTSCPKYAINVNGKCTCIWQTYADGTCGDRYCHRQYLDCSGRDLRFLNVMSIDECKQACDQEERCTSIQARPERRECWLKWYRCGNRELNVLMDGHDYARLADGETCEQFNPKYKYCARESADCAGYDLRQQYTQTAEQCQYFCTMQPECKSLQWRADTNCWIKRYICNNDQLTPSMNGIDFVKIGLNDVCTFVHESNVYCVRQGKDCVGYDIRHIYPVNTLADCQFQCDYYTNCQSIHWRDGNCWLKRIRCDAYQLTDNNSGVDAYKGECIKATEYDYCRREQEDCVGSDLRHKIATSEEDCISWCSLYPDCKSIHYRTDGNCWLKSKICTHEQLTPRIIGVDLIRILKGESCEQYKKPTNNYCVRRLMECSGADMINIAGVKSLEACQYWCDYETECLTVHWREDGNCWLKRKVCTAEQLNFNVQGYDAVKVAVGDNCDKYEINAGPYCTRDKQECAGYDIDHKYPVQSLEDCQYWCNYKANCESVHWREDKNCWIKRHQCEKYQLDLNPQGYDSYKGDCKAEPQYKFCRREKEDCEGKDLRHKVVKSEAECTEWCELYIDCKSVQYRSSDGNCWLKSVVCTASALTPRDSGVDLVRISADDSCDPYEKPETQYCVRRQMECSGADLTSRGGVLSLEACQYWCDYKTECKTVHWREDGNCWLKSKVCTAEQLYFNVQGYDAVKVSVSDTCEEYRNSPNVYCTRDKLECAGNDIERRSNVKSLADCQYWCDHKAECKSVHWREDKNCWIKRSKCERFQLKDNAQGYDSYKGECDVEPEYDYCRREKQDCTGADLRHQVTKNEAECKDWCTMYPDCKSIHYRSDGNCWLKSKVCTNDQLNPIMTGVDLIRVAKGGSCDEYKKPANKYCTRYYFDCAGHDILSRGLVNSVQFCQNWCDYRTECQSIHWREDGNCWLKRNVCSNEQLGTRLNGLDSVKVALGDSCDTYDQPKSDYCVRPNADCPGYDIRHQYPVNSLEKCQYFCNYHKDCKSIQWRRDGNCWIKKSVCLSPKPKDSSYVDAVKLMPGETCANYT